MEGKILEAYNLAKERHENQKYFRDGNVCDYIEHCRLVYETICELVPSSYPKFEILCETALLHDVIEDTDTTIEELKLRFGDEVARNVLALSKDRNLPYEDRIADSVKRIKQTSEEAKMVKLADRIINIYELHPRWGKEKSLYYLNQSRFIYKNLKKANKNLAKRLKLSIKNYSKLIKHHDFN